MSATSDQMPSYNPVFPERMEAVCSNGHTWAVSVDWFVHHVSGEAPDVAMRIPHAQPSYCEACFKSGRGAVPHVGLKHLSDTTVQAHTNASAPSCHCQRTGRSAVQRERTRIRTVVSANCSCGGLDPSDPRVCGACLVGHCMKTLWARDDAEATS